MVRDVSVFQGVKPLVLLLRRARLRTVGGHLPEVGSFLMVSDTSLLQGVKPLVQLLRRAWLMKEG